MIAIDRKLLIFNIGPVPCCVNSDSVQIAIEPPAHITAIPGSNSYRPGLFSYIKKAVAVYDVRTKFNLPTDQRGKILITNIDQRLFGFWVDNIQEIISSSQGQWQSLPVDCPKELFDGVLLYKKQLVFQTHFEALARAQVNTQIQHFIGSLLDQVEKTKQVQVDESRKIKPDTTPKLETVSKTATKTPDAFQSYTVNDTPKTIPTDLHSLNTTSKSVEKHPHATSTKNKQPLSSNNINDNRKNFSSESRQGFQKKTTSTENKTTSTPTKATPTQYRKATNHTLKKSTLDQVSDKTPGLKTLKSDTLAANQINGPHKFELNKIRSIDEKPAIPTQNIKPTSVDNTPNTSQQSSRNILALLLTLILLCIPGIAYYLFFNTPSTHTIKKRPSKTFDHQVSTETKKQMSEDSSLNSAWLNQEKHTSEQQDFEFEPESASVTELSDVYAQNEKVKDDFKDTTEEEFAEQDATIIRNENTITITLEDQQAKLIDKESEEEISSIETEPALIKKAAPELIQNEELIIQKQSEPVTEIIAQKNVQRIVLKQITHIVIKGDTLWHIAKRYIHDPFKYKQLAKLSKIKNPDLIYPGDRVIINIKKNK